MKRCFIAFMFAAGLLASCSDGGKKSLPIHLGEETDTTNVSADSASLQDELIAGEPMSVAVDELFDDFIFNFASNRRLQMERIKFPLMVIAGDKTDSISRSKWKMEYFFMKQDYYTLIFQSQQEMEQLNDTSLQEAVVEKIFLDDDLVRQYHFSRRSGRWMLYEIRDQLLPRNPNAAFLAFYKQFVADSLFQHESLAAQIDFSGPDPDDDFQQIEGMITPDFWDAFRPDFPMGMLYNIVYGHPQSPTGQKILVLRGIANGLEVEVTFQLQHGRWKLVKLTT